MNFTNNNNSSMYNYDPQHHSMVMENFNLNQPSHHHHRNNNNNLFHSQNLQNSNNGSPTTTTTTNQNLFPSISEPAMSQSSWSSSQHGIYNYNSVQNNLHQHQNQQHNSNLNTNVVDQQLQLIFELKDQIDLMCKQINHQSQLLRQVHRLKKFLNTKLNYPILKTILSDDIQLELNKFERNYRFLRKKCRKANSKKNREQQRSPSSRNLYETLYALFENVNNSSDSSLGGQNEPSFSEQSSQFAATNFCNVELKVKQSSRQQQQQEQQDLANQSGSYQQFSTEFCNVKTEPNDQDVEEQIPDQIDNDSSSSMMMMMIQNGHSQSQISPFSPNYIDSCFPLMRRGPKIKPKPPNASFRFKCQINGCPFAAKYPSVLRTHQSTHNNDYRPVPVFQCSQCPKSFKYFEALRAHRLIDHPSRQRTGNEPTSIGSSGGSMSDTDRTMDNPASYSKDSKFRCCWTECPFVSDTDHQLRQHIKLHSDETPYACHWPDCNKSFKYKSYLKHHLNRHRSDRPFKCTWPDCGYASKVLQALQAHLMVHERRQRFGNVSFRGPKFANGYKFSNNNNNNQSQDQGGGPSGLGAATAAAHRIHAGNDGANTD